MNSFNLGLPVNQIVDRISQVSATTVTSGVIYVDREGETLHRSNGVTWTEIGNLTDLTKGEFLWKLYQLTGADTEDLDVEGILYGNTDGTITSDATNFRFDTTYLSPSLKRDTGTGYLLQSPTDTIAGDETGMLWNFGGGGLEFWHRGTRQGYVGSSSYFTFNNVDVNSAGSASGPSLRFQGATTGLYIAAGGSIGITVNGTKRFEIASTYAESTVPLRLPDGSVSAPGVNFTSNTSTGVYKTGPGLAVSISGTRRFEVGDTYTESVNPLRVSDGSVSLPSVTFNSDTTTGFFKTGPGAAVSISGTKRFEIGDTYTESVNPLRVSDGSVSAPAGTFTSDTTTGLYKTGSGFAATVSGTKIIEMTSDRLVIPDGTIGMTNVPAIAFASDLATGIAYRPAGLPFNGVANMVGGVLSGGFRAGGLLTVFGTAASPAHSFIDGTGTLRELGMYAVGNTTVGIAVAGTDSARFIANQIQARDGSAAVPAVSFISDTDTGLYDTDSPEGIGVSVAASGVAKFSGSGLVVFDGSAASPGLAFSGDPENAVTHQRGISSDGTNISVSTATVERARFGSQNNLYANTGISTGLFAVASNSAAFDLASGSEITPSTGTFIFANATVGGNSLKSAKPGSMDQTGVLLILMASGMQQAWTFDHDTGSVTAGFYPFILDTAADHTISQTRIYMYQFILDKTFAATAATGAWIQMSPRATVV